MRFKGKTVFITGASGFIGFITASDFAAEGANVALCDINRETLNGAVEKIISNGGKAQGYIADVTNYNELEKAVNSAKEHFGSLDIFIHAAGGSAREKSKPLINQEIEVIKNVIDINLMGGLYGAKVAAKIMAEQKSGRIIFFTSTVGLMGLKGLVDYSAAKAGLMSAAKALAKELGEHSVTVNCVCPGIVLRPEEERDVSHTNFLKRNCKPKDISKTVLFLASDDASFITGQNFVVDGGRSLSMKGTD